MVSDNLRIVAYGVNNMVLLDVDVVYSIREKTESVLEVVISEVLMKLNKVNRKK